MLKPEPIEFLLRALPEGFLLILGMYVFAKQKFDKKRYFVSSIISSIIVYFIRELPISYGVHTIIIIVVLILLSVFYNEIDLYRTVRSTISVFIVQYVSEAINVIGLRLIPNLDLNIIFKDPILKNVSGIPSVIITTIIIYVFYRKFKKKDGLVNDYYWSFIR